MLDFSFAGSMVHCVYNIITINFSNFVFFANFTSGLSMSDLCRCMSFSNLPFVIVVCIGVVGGEPSSPPRPPSLGWPSPATPGSSLRGWSWTLKTLYWFQYLLSIYFGIEVIKSYIFNGKAQLGLVFTISWILDPFIVNCLSCRSNL